MGNYCITFPLITEKYQEDILAKRFEIGRKIYNAVLSGVCKRYKSMTETRRYRQSKDKVKELYNLKDRQSQKALKEVYADLNGMHKEFRINEYSLHTDVKDMQKHFKANMDSFTAQKIATRVWKSIERLLFGDGETVHFKKYGELNSLEGKSNDTGIRFKDNHIVWNGLKIPVQIDYNNPYEYRAIQDEICYCRIKRKFVRGKYKYYLQIVLKGVPPMKVNKDGEIKRDIGTGIVGLDIGTQTVAISSTSEVKLVELADRVQDIEGEKRRLLRYIDRSRRATNPDNYNTDGTIRKQGNKKVVWVKSKRYEKAQCKLKELYRKQADVREYQHQLLSNHIISLGDAVKVEDMNYKGLQARSKKTEKNDKGKYKRKKRFGKSLANKAPSKLLTMIDNKLKYWDKALIKVNTQEVKASQYNHFDEQCSKKQLNERWNDFHGVKVQRDLYSAFLIQHVNDDLKSIDRERCIMDFEQFKIMHDIEIYRLNKSELSKALKNVI